MAEKTVTVPGKVRSAYEQLEESFKAVVEDANVILRYPSRPLASSFVESGPTHVEFTRCWYLKGWPSRRLGKKKRLDVVVKAMETLTRSDWQMHASTVYVNYVVADNDGSGAKLVQALHYDFKTAGQKDHPYFHVQVSNEAIPGNDLQSVECDLISDMPAEAADCVVTTRIPTPDMTLASVLCCLVADHIGTERFAAFAASLHDIQTALPPTGFEPIRKSLEGAPHFKSSHWFAHSS